MVAQHYRWDFIGLSTDEKPTPATSEKVVDGSTFYCSDTSKLYVFCKDNWYERKALGGGGGGTTYTAGDGIDITNDTISVDTDTIQEKLTAGTGIDITNNTISATGGGGPTVVQTTGTSTTDVMSQNAVTSMIFDNPSDQDKVRIATNSSVNGNYAIAIGRSAAARSNYSLAIGSSTTATGTASIAIGRNSGGGGTSLDYTVALGESATPTRAGEVNVGAGNTNHGYNSTNYRVIGGVHDGVNAHDATTVGQINSVIDAINTALSTNIPHIGS